LAMEAGYRKKLSQDATYVGFYRQI
jgi:hypothetical protein